MIYRLSLITMSVVLSFAVVAGCAKRPVMSAATSPAPSGAAMSPAAPPAPAPAPAPLAAAPRAAESPAAAPPTTPPPAQRPPRADFAAVPQLRDINFDFDKYDIRPDSAKTLDANAKWLNENKNQLVLIEGHCDERGTNEYNQALGERRARATMDYLMSRGVQRNRITIISYGEERPLCTEKNEACWAKNRRASTLAKAD